MTVAAVGRKRSSAKGAALEKLPKWGWLEWLTLSLPLMPGLVFIPGLSFIRVVVRISAFLLPMVAWYYVASKGKRRSGRESFKPFATMKFCIVWVLIEILNPMGIAAPFAVLAEAMLTISVISPLFWTAYDLKTSKQVPRMMMILFLCNALGGVMGILQVRYPGRFDPPAIPAFQALGEEMAMGIYTYQTDDGRSIMRPCGLTDTPGGACIAGAAAGLLGLCWALRPLAIWKRGFCLLMSFLGIAAVYYTQVRSLLVVEVVCIMVLVALFTLQGNVIQATQIGVLGTGLILGSLVWVAINVGGAVLDRFGTLVKEDQGKLYQNSRGMFVQDTFTKTIFEYPLGAGMGRFGQTQAYFGSSSVSAEWAEVQWPAWLLDGGIVLLFAYPYAVVAAILDSMRVALRSKDKDLAYWAAVVVAVNISTFATCFSQMPFLAAGGLQFWTFAAVIHAADRRVREESARTA